MLRHILHELEWGIAFVLLTLILFLIISLLTITPVIADITETNIAPGHVHCRSEQMLTDEAGHKWDVMFFTEVSSSSNASLNLRLSGLSSSVYIQSQKPLIIDVLSDRSDDSAKVNLEVANIFFEESPLPTIGQYDLKNIFPRLPISDLLLEIPLENGRLARLPIPKTLVQEWQEIALRNSELSPPIPPSLELIC
ncbi:MAG: DUF3122 domain-containing protein [Pleurocapsa sp. MO_226.B13]|nr:DUF3122 domain-containing protein [Pleurocapsa sp. MO_226.B13]